jgi:hypothetical protein
MRSPRSNAVWTPPLTDTCVPRRMRFVIMARYAHLTLMATFLWIFLLLGCNNDAAPPHNGSTRVISPSAPAVPVMVSPEGSLPIRFSDPPEPGEKARFVKSEHPETLNVSPVGHLSTKALHQWYLTRHALGPGTRDSIFVARERWATGEGISDATCVLMYRGQVAEAFSLQGTAPSSSGMPPRSCTVRLIDIPSERSLLLIRTDSAFVHGTERFLLFGLTHRDALVRYLGPMEHFRDGDLPGRLVSGQVLYAHVPLGWVSVPLPLTFEPAAHRFVPEVSEDGILPASGSASFRGSADGSMLIRLTSSLDKDASALSVPLAPGTSVVARKAHVPWLAPGADTVAPRTGCAVYVEAGTFSGWLADTLLDRFTPETKR